MGLHGFDGRDGFDALAGQAGFDALAGQDGFGALAGQDGFDGHPAADRLTADVAMLCSLVELGVRVDGEITESSEADGERWLIYGRASDDEAVVLAAYDDAAEAAAVLQAVPRSLP